MELSLDLRIGWACHSWVLPMNEVARFFFGQSHFLREWHIIRGTPAAAAGESQIIDQFLLSTTETLSRVFWGLHARGMCLWSGGVYNLVKLCSPSTACRQEAIDRAAHLFPRLLALEQVMAKGNMTPELLAFESHFLWFHGTVYRELLGLVAEGRLDEATVYSWQLHSSVYHVKGQLVS